MHILSPNLLSRNQNLLLSSTNLNLRQLAWTSDSTSQAFDGETCRGPLSADTAAVGAWQSVTVNIIVTQCGLNTLSAVQLLSLQSCPLKDSSFGAATSATHTDEPLQPRGQIMSVTCPDLTAAGQPAACSVYSRTGGRGGGLLSCEPTPLCGLARSHSLSWAVGLPTRLARLEAPVTRVLLSAALVILIQAAASC